LEQKNGFGITIKNPEFICPENFIATAATIPDRKRQLSFISRFLWENGIDK
jgi:hypothetical protein